jgi:hypothetical protein
LEFLEHLTGLLRPKGWREPVGGDFVEGFGFLLEPENLVEVL